MASWASMWSKNGTPVSMVLAPVPSRSSSTRTLLSLVLRSTRAVRLIAAFLVARGRVAVDERLPEHIVLLRRAHASRGATLRARLPDEHAPVEQALPDGVAIVEACRTG